MKSSIQMGTLVAMTLALTTVAATPVQAADPAVTCESGKLKEAGKYGNCRLKAESKAVKKGEAADYSKCETNFADKWSKTETKAGPGICPSEGDESALNTLITEHADEVAAKLSGVRYEDTGLGTVIDHETGLEWQKTDDAGGLTDKDNVYTWTVGFDEPSGTAFTEFLYGLNGGTASSGAGPTTGCYADHCDWRMPLIEELTTIVDCSFGNPCIDQSVFGATAASSFYWSSSTSDFTPDFAWFVDFADGLTLLDSENFLQVRAVRGGS